MQSLEEIYRPSVHALKPDVRQRLEADLADIFSRFPSERIISGTQVFATDDIEGGLRITGLACATLTGLVVAGFDGNAMVHRCVKWSYGELETVTPYESGRWLSKQLVLVVITKAPKKYSLTLSDTRGYEFVEDAEASHQLHLEGKI